LDGSKLVVGREADVTSDHVQHGAEIARAPGVCKTQAGESLVDGFAPDSFDESIGGSVVADCQHEIRKIAKRDFRRITKTGQTRRAVGPVLRIHHDTPRQVQASVRGLLEEFQRYEYLERRRGHNRRVGVKGTAKRNRPSPVRAPTHDNPRRQTTSSTVLIKRLRHVVQPDSLAEVRLPWRARTHAPNYGSRVDHDERRSAQVCGDPRSGDQGHRQRSSHIARTAARGVSDARGVAGLFPERAQLRILRDDSSDLVPRRVIVDVLERTTDSAVVPCELLSELANAPDELLNVRVGGFGTRLECDPQC
jgi:hypothetical protein